MQSSLYLKETLTNKIPVYLSRISKQDARKVSFKVPSLTENAVFQYLLKSTFAHLSDEDALHLMAEVQSFMLAVGAIEKFALSDQMSIGFLSFSALMETERQKETATLLVRTLIEWARKTGVIRLETFVSRKQRDNFLFFKGFGFKIGDMSYPRFEAYFNNYAPLYLDLSDSVEL